MSHTEIVNYSFVHAVLPAGSRTTETENRRTPAEGAGRGSLASRMRAVERRKERERRNEEGRGVEGEGAHREIKTRERERETELVTGSETGHSCFIGALRLPPRRRRRREEGGRRWNEQAIYEKEAKNEDEVNDIHGGYRILPARSHLRLPCLLLSLLRFFPTPPLLFVLDRVLSRSIRYVSFSEPPSRLFPSSRRVNNVYVCVYILPVAPLSTCV